MSMKKSQKIINKRKIGTIIKELRMNITLVIISAVFIQIGCDSKNSGSKEPLLKKISEINQKTTEALKETVVVRETVLVADISKIHGESIAELWVAYKKARKESQKYMDKNEFDKSIKSLLKAGDFAKKLNESGIASWQFNNAAKHAIDKFRTITNYTARMDSLNTMKFGEVKIKLKKSTVSIIKNNMETLEMAKGYLEEALELDSMQTDSKRYKIIQNNIDFINNMYLFVQN